ncbi:MAG TPA: thiamine pyrophosphate-binding protein [Thermomicrobiales bacterium]|nr:thiamine pyrophosphate-binding protein [Thermomicrobiales bacterium]
MPQLTGGEAVVASLIANGVDTVFGLPGVQMDNLFDAFYGAQDKIRVIHTRHEQTTAYMAFGYAQTTGKVGVCVVVPGPGLLNAAGALSTAWACNAPVLVIAGQVWEHQYDKNIGALHEIPDQRGMIEHIMKSATFIERPEDAPAAVQEAFRQLQSGRVRPVEIEMTPDMMGRTAEVTLLGPAEPDAPPAIDDDALEQAAKILGQAEYPVIMAGGGAIDAGEALRELSEMLQAPLILTPNAKGAVSDREPLTLSLLGGHKIWAKADAVLAVGTRFDRALLDWGLEGMKIVRIDIDPAEFGKVQQPDVAILAQATDALPKLADAVGKHNRSRQSRTEEIAAVREAAQEELFEKGQPQASICEVIREELPDDGIFVGDITQVAAYADLGYPVYQPRTYVGAGFQGTLGYGYATSLGVQVGAPGRKVVSINGDGGFMYTQPELATAKQFNIPVVAIVFNDGAYGNVKAIQRTRYGGREIASTLENPDFVKLADAFGVAGYRAESPEQLRDVLKDAFAQDGPALIDYPTAPMPMVRMMSRGKVR